MQPTDMHSLLLRPQPPLLPLPPPLTATGMYEVEAGHGTPPPSSPSPARETLSTLGHLLAHRPIQAFPPRALSQVLRYLPSRFPPPLIVLVLFVVVVVVVFFPFLALDHFPELLEDL